jgi:hypothetical protein
MGFSLSGVWHGMQDVWYGATGQKSWEERQQDQTAQDAAKHGNSERDALQAQAKGLHVGDYDPPSIQQQDHWQGMSQDEIHTRNQQLNQGNAEAVGDAWISIADELRKKGPAFTDGLKQKIASGWEGQAAEAASRVGDPLAKWMADSANAFQDTGIRIKEAASAAGQVQQMIGPSPKPNMAQQFGQGIAAVGGGPVAGPMLGSYDQVQQMQQQQQDQKAAQETMARVLGATYTQADSQVPAYQDVHGNPVTPPPPPPPGQVSPPPPPVSPHGGTAGGGGMAGGGMSSVPGGAGSGAPGGGMGGMPGSAVPAGTQAAGAAAPPLAGDLGSGAMPGGGAAGGAGGGAGGAGMMGGVGGMAGGRAGDVGAGGRAGTASSSGSGAGGRGGSSGSGAGGRGSNSSSSSPGARGGHGRGGEDDEHERPSWLEEHDDIWLNDMPSVAPPVFGE